MLKTILKVLQRDKTRAVSKEELQEDDLDENQAKDIMAKNTFEIYPEEQDESTS